MNAKRILLTLFAVVGFGAVAAWPATAATPRTITVQGTGIVNTVPDRAQFTFGVSVTGPTAKAALTANAARMNGLIAAVKARGIPASAIQTAEVSLTPNTSQNGNKILNFTAADSVTVTTKVIAQAGSIVDAAVAAGANTVSGPSLSPSNQAALQRAALQKAVADAHARALAIAQAAHVQLGAVRTVTEGTSTPITFGEAPKAAAAVASTPLEPGTVQVEEDVTVTYAIA
jgi:uncharacterized protein YggE